MFEFLRFGRAKDVMKSNVVVAPINGQSKNSDKRREMIRLALNSVLRRHGIASQWIGCEFVSMARPGGADVMLTQLVILRWHDGLMRYAPELQDELFKEIHLFDKSALASNFLFVWKFAPDCGYPNGKLPEPEFWTSRHDLTSVEAGSPVKSGIAVAITAAPVVKFDLPKSKRDDDDRDNGFAATQIVDQE